jgi:Flp pilus assembly protein TadG
MIRTNRRRSGTILPLVAISLVALVGLVAMAVDIGLLTVARTQAQDAADLAALAGARLLNGDTSNSSNLNNINNAISTAQDRADDNKILTQVLSSSQIQTRTGIYTYDSTAQRFNASFPSSPGTNAWSVMEVTLSGSAATYFGRVFNINSFAVKTQAVAAHRPRDISLILDFSGSMKFGTESGFYTSGSGAIRGSLNGDSSIPKFGPWYAMSQRALETTNTNATSNGTGYNPLQRTILFQDPGGETHASNNLTIESHGGPPVAQDWLSDSTGTRLNAFYNPQASGSYNPAQTPTAMPAPDNFKDQSSSPDTYVGDKHPRVNGATTGNSWAQTVVQYKNATDTTLANSHTINQNATSWEKAGGASAYTTSNSTDDALGYGASFKGYSMGPGYYGKTFFIWPPDPRYSSGADPTSITTSTTGPVRDTSNRYICDWRKRFFNYGATYGSTTAQKALRGTPCDDNSLLFNSSGYLQQPSSAGYAVNYAAILAWIKSGPQVLPPSLCTGRVRYYSSIPSTIPSSGLSLDQVFWKWYIDTVLGIASTNLAANTLYGRETGAWGTLRITAKSSLTASPAPYMHYNDNPIRPRAHFWFGPLTMMMFLTTDNDGTPNMWPGTVHESHCWQLKAGINSALDDIKNNHPNDWASMIFFSNISSYSTARVAAGRSYTQMKNALFFPYSLLNNLSDNAQEIRPYDSSFNYTGSGDIPNAAGGTCPDMAFKVAYNQFSGATGYNGRHGASKVVVFETDGVPNAYCGGSFQNNGAYLSLYTGSIGSATSVGNNASTATDPAVADITQICALDTASKPGYSTARNSARVHAIAFGDLFETSQTQEQNALAFLLRVQQAGNTSAATDTSIESYKIITGDYTTRIDNIRQAMERIMQSGIQVSLIR